MDLKDHWKELALKQITEVEDFTDRMYPGVVFPCPDGLEEGQIYQIVDTDFGFVHKPDSQVEEYHILKIERVAKNPIYVLAMLGESLIPVLRNDYAEELFWDDEKMVWVSPKAEENASKLVGELIAVSQKGTDQLAAYTTI